MLPSAADDREPGENIRVARRARYIAVHIFGKNDMNPVRSRTFKSGNGVALHLPGALGVAANVEMRIEKDGDGFVVRPARDPAAENAKVRRLVEALAAFPVPDAIQPRDPIDFPDRLSLT
jgi:antitoxin VapB